MITYNEIKRSDKKEIETYWIEYWKDRNLSYDINNFKKAFYRYFQLEIIGSNIQKITKTLNQNDNIIRHLFIKVNKHQELPTKLNYEKN